MSLAPQLLLIGAVAAVGVLHTMVPDHWVPIALLARERSWSKSETTRAALQAGTGHVVSTLAIALAVWAAGAVFADRFRHLVDLASSLTLIGFGGWIAISAWRELDHGHSHSHPHRHEHDRGHSHPHTHVHPDLALIAIATTTTRKAATGAMPIPSWSGQRHPGDCRTTRFMPRCAAKPRS